MESKLAFNSDYLFLTPEFEDLLIMLGLDDIKKDKIKRMTIDLEAKEPVLVNITYITENNY